MGNVDGPSLGDSDSDEDVKLFGAKLGDAERFELGTSLLRVVLGVTVGVPVGPVVGTVVGTSLGLLEGKVDGTIGTVVGNALEPRDGIAVGVPFKARSVLGIPVGPGEGSLLGPLCSVYTCTALGVTLGRVVGRCS